MPRFLHRFCSAARALSVLEQRTLFLAPPSSLNDPFEFAGAVDIECTEDDRKEILDMAARHELGLSEQQIVDSQAKRDEMAKTEFYISLLSYRIRGILSYLREFAGVCCFTRDCEHVLLWSHYADAHCGVCLVFNNLDGTCPIFDAALPVVYADDIPKLRLLDFYKDRRRFLNDIYMLLHTKQTAWSYELEWRVVHPSTRPLSDDERLLHFDEQHLCKVILGDRISPEYRDAIRAKDHGRKFPLLIYQARVLDQRNTLAYKLLPPGFDYPSHAAWNKLPDPHFDSPFPFADFTKSV